MRSDTKKDFVILRFVGSLTGQQATGIGPGAGFGLSRDPEAAQ